MKQAISEWPQISIIAEGYPLEKEAPLGVASKRQPWGEVQNIASLAAEGLGVKPTHAFRFGAALACYLADGFGPKELHAILSAPDEIDHLCALVGDLVEGSSTGQVVHEIPSNSIQHPELLWSFLKSLPCLADVDCASPSKAWRVRLDLSAPSQMRRPAMIDLPADLHKKLQVLADRALEMRDGSSGLRGISAMEIDGQAKGSSG